jgi:hypothetical protein
MKHSTTRERILTRDWMLSLLRFLYIGFFWFPWVLYNNLVDCFQVGQDDTHKNVLLELFSLTAKQQIFNQLRTVEQLGYIVSLAKRCVRSHKQTLWSTSCSCWASILLHLPSTIFLTYNHIHHPRSTEGVRGIVITVQSTSKVQCASTLYNFLFLNLIAWKWSALAILLR